MHYDSTLGAYLVAGGITAILYGATCIQAYAFFHQLGSKPWPLSCSVCVLWALCTLHLAFTGIELYLHLVTNFGDIEKVLTHVFWSQPGIDVVTIITTLFVQCWYCHRVWVLSDKNVALTYILIFIITVWFGFGLASCIEISLLKNLPQFQSVVWLSLASVSVTTFADFYIAISLCYFLYKQRKCVLPRTSSLLNTIIMYTVSTGLVTSLVSVCYIFTSLTLPDTWVWVGVYMTLDGLYCNSLLAWLNARDHFRQKLGNSTTAPAAPRSAPMSSIQFAHGGLPSRSHASDMSDSHLNSSTSNGANTSKRKSSIEFRDLP